MIVYYDSIDELYWIDSRKGLYGLSKGRPHLPIHKLGAQGREVSCLRAAKVNVALVNTAQNRKQSLEPGCLGPNPDCHLLVDLQ